jgi:aldose 1-epimerase
MLTRVPFGLDLAGRPTQAWRLRSAAGLEAWLLGHGATLARLRLPARDGGIADVVLGFDSLAAYQQPHPYLGAMVGRHANRIRDGRFLLAGQAVQLACNDGPHHLHGGPEGFDRRTWAAHPLAEGDAPAIEFVLHSEDGDQGYPGALAARVRYTLDGASLRIDTAATSDRPTVVNLAQHAYFDLAGSADIRALELQVQASHYLPVDAGRIPTGELRAVQDTPFDWRRAQPIHARLAELARVEPGSIGFDHCYVLDGEAGTLRLAAELTDPASGHRLRLHTDQPGLQVYTGNFLDGTLRGRDGMAYARHAGLCLEAQYFPDGPNHAHFPDPLLTPGDQRRQATVLEFE